MSRYYVGVKSITAREQPDPSSKIVKTHYFSEEIRVSDFEKIVGDDIWTELVTIPPSYAITGNARAGTSYLFSSKPTIPRFVQKRQKMWRVNADGFWRGNMRHQMLGVEIQPLAFYGQDYLAGVKSTEEDIDSQLDAAQSCGFAAVWFSGVHCNAKITDCIDLTTKVLDKLAARNMFGIVMLDHMNGSSGLSQPDQAMWRDEFSG